MLLPKLNNPKLRLRLGLLSAAVLIGGGEARGGDLVFSYDFEDGLTQTDLELGFAASVTVEDGLGVGGSRALKITEGLGTQEVFWNLNPDGSAETGEVLHISYDHRMDTGGTNIPYLLPNYGDASTQGTSNYRQYAAIGHRPRDNGNAITYEARNGVNLNKVDITPLPGTNPVPLDGTFNRVDIYLPLFDIADPSKAGFGRALKSDLQSALGATNFPNINNPGGAYTAREIRSLQWFSSGFGFGLSTYIDNLTVETITLNAADIDAVLADINGTPTDLSSDFTFDIKDDPSNPGTNIPDGDLNNIVDLRDRDVFIEDILLSHVGDFNFDRQVDSADLGILAASWQQSVTSYADGDANGDGFVDVLDLNDLALRWLRGVPEPAAEPGFGDALAQSGIFVPEPGAGVLIGTLLAGMGLARRRGGSGRHG